MAIAQVVAGARILISDLNAYYSLFKGSVGEAITFAYNAAGSLIFQPSSDPATGTELVQIKNNVGTVQLALSSDGKVYAGDGNESLPGLTFEGDKDTGMWRVSSNTLALSTLGTERLRVNTTGVSVDGGLAYLSSLDGATNRWRHAWGGYALPTDTAVTGTGGIAVTSNPPFLRTLTGATSGSTASVRSLIRNGTVWSVGVARRIEFQVNLVNIDANTTGYVLITNESTLNAPSLTANHIGIKNVAGAVSFTTADGATEQTTAITSFVTQAQDTTYIVTFDGTTARLYIDGVLRATHATNVPTSTLNQALVWRAYIVNSAASSKIMDVARVDGHFATQ